MNTLTHEHNFTTNPLDLEGMVVNTMTIKNLTTQTSGEPLELSEEWEDQEEPDTEVRVFPSVGDSLQTAEKKLNLLRTKIAAEMLARTLGDASNYKLITTEVAARESAVALEKEERIAAVNLEKEERIAAVNLERGERIAADAALGTEITTQVAAATAATALLETQVIANFAINETEHLAMKGDIGALEARIKIVEEREDQNDVYDDTEVRGLISSETAARENADREILQVLNQQYEEFEEHEEEEKKFQENIAAELEKK